MEQILISGQYNNPVGQPLAGVRIILVSRGTSNSTFAGAQVVATTDEWGKYSFNIVPGRYVASAVHPDGREDYLGVMDVLPGSEPGTLNDFITALVPMDARPAILLAMQEILNETRDLASGAVARPTGEYDGDKAYNVNDLVQFDGSEYRATAQVTGVSPPLAPWELFLSRGEPGEAGAANVLSIGKVYTLDPDKPAEAKITGEAPEQTLDLSIPRGKDGEPGPVNILTIGTVKTLPAGSEAVAEITGESPSQVLNLALPEGGKGREGDAGPANRLTIGTVTTLKPGSNSTAEITGDAPDQVLNQGIPAGAEGDPGPANTLSIERADTLPPGSEATAEITGEAPAQKLVLGIPQGQPGEAATGGVQSVDGVTPDDSGNITLGAFTPNNIQICEPGSPGSSIFASLSASGGTPGTLDYGFGEIFEGASISPCCVYWNEKGDTDFLEIMFDGPHITLSGSWACGGQAMWGFSATLWTRIDTDPDQASDAEARILGETVRNCRYVREDGQAINCEILLNGHWLPFTATPNDPAAHGRRIFAAAVEGAYGEIKEYATAGE